MRIQPQAVIFDYGNVLCEAQEPEDLEAMAAVLRLTYDAFLPIYWSLRQPYDRTELDPTTYWNLVAAQCGRALTAAEIERLVDLDNISWAHPSPVMVDWANQVRGAGVRTAVLSNMPLPLREYLDCRCPWMPEFDHRTFSCDVRMCKPDPAIYAHALRGLGIQAGDALFLDDREENIRAARDLGLHAVLFSGPEQAWTEIERGFSLPAAIPC